jgi:hypothetical protein
VEAAASSDGASLPSSSAASSGARPAAASEAAFDTDAPIVVLRCDVWCLTPREWWTRRVRPRSKGQGLRDHLGRCLHPLLCKGEPSLDSLPQSCVDPCLLLTEGSLLVGERAVLVEGAGDVAPVLAVRRGDGATLEDAADPIDVESLMQVPGEFLTADVTAEVLLGKDVDVVQVVAVVGLVADRPVRNAFLDAGIGLRVPGGSPDVGEARAVA